MQAAGGHLCVPRGSRSAKPKAPSSTVLMPLSFFSLPAGRWRAGQEGAASWAGGTPISSLHSTGPTGTSVGQVLCRGDGRPGQGCDYTLEPALLLGKVPDGSVNRRTQGFGHQWLPRWTRHSPPKVFVSLSAPVKGLAGCVATCPPPDHPTVLRAIGHSAKQGAQSPSEVAMKKIRASLHLPQRSSLLLTVCEIAALSKDITRML